MLHCVIYEIKLQGNTPSIENVNQCIDSKAGHLEKLMILTNTIPFQTHKFSVPAKNSFLCFKEKHDSLYFICEKTGPLALRTMSLKYDI
jgi:hypothetical protein